MTEGSEDKDRRGRFHRDRLVAGVPEQADATRRLGDLRRSQPNDVTLKNLVALLTTKLELCARLPVFAFESGNEGDERGADSFRALAEAERRSCEDVIECLRAHLDHTARSGV